MTRTVGLLGVVIAVANTGCSSMSQTEKGVGIGAALGAGAGTLIGAATGNPKTGAVVGGLMGAGIGGIAGNEADQREKERNELRQATAVATAPAPAGPLGLTDVVSMSNGDGKVSDDVLVTYIRQTNSRFTLSPGDIQYLKQNNVSDRVVTEMINTGTRPASAPRTVVVREQPTTVIYREPVYVAPRPIIYAPPPPGLAFHYRSW